MSSIKQLLSYHVFPLIAAIATLTIFIYSGYPLAFYSSNKAEIQTYKYDDIPKEYRHVGNYQDSIWAELAVAQSFFEKDHLTVFGSSELSSSSDVCFNFLPEKTGKKVTAVGHAFNELFAIYCQLLHFEPYLDSAKVSIILSPGWFEDGLGTNPQSFIEFVPPHFIANFMLNENIDEDFKNYVAETYTQFYRSEISGGRFEYQFLDTYNRFPVFKDFSKVMNKKYKLELSTKTNVSNAVDVNWNQMVDSAKNAILPSLNEFFIDTAYFRKWLMHNDGKMHPKMLPEIDVESNAELKDLEMVMKFLKSKNCEVSFVMQPLNPNYYGNLEIFDETMVQVDDLMKTYGYDKNYLNLFSKEISKYKPGILRDVMHFSGYGWITVNQFLYEQHFDK